MLFQRKGNKKKSSKDSMSSSQQVDAPERPKRSSTYFLLLIIIIIVAVYTGLTMSTMDSVSMGEVGNLPPTTKQSIPSSTAEVASTATATTTDTATDTDTDSPKINEESGDSDGGNSPILDENGVVEPASIPISTTATKEECEGFDHGNTSSKSNVTSIFNCGSESGTCHWYFPSRFLNPCGVGKEFIPRINEMKELYNNKTLWLNGPPIVIPWASFDPAKMRDGRFRFHNGPWLRHNISMTHVHKTGGTSLVTAFSSVLGRGAKGMRHTVYMPARTPPPRRKPMGNATASQKRPTRAPRKPPQSIIYGPSFHKASNFLDGAVKYRNKWGMKQHTLFAVIRDPADRFISAIGQATGAFGSSMNGVSKMLVEKCVKETPKESLSCFIDLVHKNTTWVEVHFTPMVMEISFATIYKDIPVAVFPFTEVPNLMRELGADPSVKKKDGHKKGYRKDEVLTNMKVSDYDEDMMKKLCDVFKMDAVFMHHLGMENSCDPYVTYPEAV